MHSNTFKFKIYVICIPWWNNALGVWVVLSVSVDTRTMHISNMTLKNSKRWTNEKKHWILKFTDRELKKVTSGEFVISLALSHCKKNLKPWTDQCYTSVLFRKQRTNHPPGLRVGWPKRHEEKKCPQPNLAPFLNVFFSSTWVCPM